MTKLDTGLWAVFTDDGLDQIVETEALAKREAKDLREMGCDKVKIVMVQDEDHADAISRKILGY